MQSHPTWVRGLKQMQQALNQQQNEVAPYVGAWIETPVLVEGSAVSEVAPYVGAWIETKQRE